MRVERDLLNSRIVGLFLESLVCGIFVVTYSLGAWSLIRRDQPVTLSRRNKTLLGVNTLMLALAVVHLCLTLQTTLDGFVANGATRETTYDALFDDSLFFSSVNEAQFYLYVTQTLIGDGFMVYRLSVVWNSRRTIIVVPAILFLIDVVSGYCYAVMPFMALVFFAFSFFTNALSSALIMWRVLRSKSSEAQDHWRWHSRAIFNFVKYRRVFEAIIQSAAIYSTASISLLVTMFISPNIGLYACLSVFPPLIVRPSAPLFRDYYTYIASVGSRVLTHRDADCTQFCDHGPRLLMGPGLACPVISYRRTRVLHRRPTRLHTAASTRFEGVRVAHPHEPEFGL
ncbi:hypothetical protein LXA43DRAFT_992439 [Ganoderma leucocontextum]|nr:hypothetical protein LXA43DRAFT_992439 [Ganoderma leucocontextum]